MALNVCAWLRYEDPAIAVSSHVPHRRGGIPQVLAAGQWSLSAAPPAEFTQNATGIPELQDVPLEEKRLVPNMSKVGLVHSCSGLG